jgi:hypothetical protein
VTPKKVRMGRPPVSKKLQKGALLSVRFSESERLGLARAAARHQLSVSEWARRTLLSAAAPNGFNPRE